MSPDSDGQWRPAEIAGRDDLTAGDVPHRGIPGTRTASRLRRAAQRSRQRAATAVQAATGQHASAALAAQAATSHRATAGEPLGLRQEEIKFSGHAIEVRLCSEDATSDFMPQSGRMALWQMPDELRVEQALQSGSEIPPFYDSMIAKLIVKGRDRTEAIGRMKRALEMFVIEGIKTSIPLHRRILADPDFAAGKFDTHFIERLLGTNGK